MNGEVDKKREAEIEHEIGMQRKTSFGDALAREAGSIFKGAQAVPEHKQAQVQIGGFIREHLRDSSGALSVGRLRPWQVGSLIVSNTAYQAGNIACAGRRCDAVDLV